MEPLLGRFTGKQANRIEECPDHQSALSIRVGCGICRGRRRPVAGVQDLLSSPGGRTDTNPMFLRSAARISSRDRWSVDHDRFSLGLSLHSDSLQLCEATLGLRGSDTRRKGGSRGSGPEQMARTVEELSEVRGFGQLTRHPKLLAVIFATGFLMLLLGWPLFAILFYPPLLRPWALVILLLVIVLTSVVLVAKVKSFVRWWNARRAKTKVHPPK